MPSGVGAGLLTLAKGFKMIVREPISKYSKKQMRRFELKGRNFALNLVEHISCWDAVAIAVKKGIIDDRRDPVEKFIEGYKAARKEI